MAQKNIKMSSPGHEGQVLGQGQPGTSFASVDEEPRLPPRLSRFPAPFDFPEKPVLQVPDVSLIVADYYSGDGSSSAALGGVAHLFASPTLPNNTPNLSSSTLRPSFNKTPVTHLSENGVPAGINRSGSATTAANFLNLDGLLKELISQREVIGGIQNKLDKLVGIESKLDNLIQFQDEFLANLFRRGALVSKEVQTEGGVANVVPVAPARKLNSNPSANVSRRSSPTTTTTESGSSGTSTTSRTSTPFGAGRTQQPHQHQHHHSKRGGGGPLARILNEEMKGGNHQDSLSAIQLPSITLNEPSALFSEASGIKSLQLQEFHDDSFNSGSGADSPVLNASAYRSDSYSSRSSEDDEEDASSPVIKIQKPGGSGSGGHGVNVNVKSSNPKIRTPSSSSSSSSSSRGNGNVVQVRGSGCHPLHPQEPPKPKQEDEVVLKTKQYLETLGVRFSSPTPGNYNQNQPTPNRNNYMIQQNVYNSIYIPTVNCAPVVPETFPTSGTGSNFHSLAQKYANPEELREFDAMKASGNPGQGTETTLYGMTASNLSFATKDYLQRYGLVTNSTQNHSTSAPPPPPSQTPNRNFNPIPNPNGNPTHPPPAPHRHRHHRSKPSHPPPVGANREKDRILNMTAIKNQPRLL